MRWNGRRTRCANARSAASTQVSCFPLGVAMLLPHVRISNATMLYRSFKRGSSICVLSQEESRKRGCNIMTVGFVGSKSLVPPIGVFVVYHSETRSSLDTKSMNGMLSDEVSRWRAASWSKIKYVVAVNSVAIQSERPPSVLGD